MTLKPSAPDGSAPAWIKSSYSGSDDNDCVEAACTAGTVQVRDSKNTRGPRLAFAHSAWTDFLSYARA